MFTGEGIGPAKRRNSGHAGTAWRWHLLLPIAFRNSHYAFALSGEQSLRRP